MPDGDITTVVAVDIGGTNYLGFQHAGVTHVDAATGEQLGFDPRIDPRVSGAIYEFLIVDGTERGRVFEVLRLSDLSSDVVVLDYLYDDFLTEIGGVGNLAAAAQTYFYSPVNPNVRVDEAVQVDVLNVFNGNDVSNNIGGMTEDLIYGLGMGPDTVIGETQLRGGISYNNLERLHIELGSGADDFLVESTHIGETTLQTGGGNDDIGVQAISGHTVIDTQGDDDLVTVTGKSGLVDQIGALLTLETGSDVGDTVVISDSADTTDNVGRLTETTLRGLDMPQVAQVQQVYVQARSGQFTLAANGL
ncbi:MAG: hypothetical protein KDB23_33265, partial [Planctomycetales bacterium]|nr:hypothetical protein [Planctomycetales bacterium]